MNSAKLLITRPALLLCAGLAATLSACTTYVEQPRSDYQPPPREVYVPPPAVVVQPPPVMVEVEIRSEDDFYEPLRPYGRWENVGPYGRCWVPARVEADWRPYCNGHWERTEAGWYWASDEPWAWATYHYGRWDFSPEVGWYWVPQTQWAPAWVSWHRGEGYVGWAPLNPSERMDRGGAIEVDVRAIQPRAYVFVEEKRFLEPVRPQTVIENNTTIINKTVNITNVKVVNNTVINEGPRTTVIEQASGRTVRPVPVRELRRKSEAEVVAKQKIAQPVRERNVQASPAPVRRETVPREQTVDAQRQRAQDRQTQEDALKNARQRQVQAEADRRAQEAQKKTQVEAERRAKDLQSQTKAEEQRARQKEAQLQADQRAQEARKKAQLEADQRAQDTQRRSQIEADRRAKAQLEADQRKQEAQLKTQREAEARAKSDQGAREKGKRPLTRAQQKKLEEEQKQQRQNQQQQQPSPDKPVAAPPPP